MARLLLLCSLVELSSPSQEYGVCSPYIDLPVTERSSGHVPISISKEAFGVKKWNNSTSQWDDVIGSVNGKTRSFNSCIREQVSVGEGHFSVKNVSKAAEGYYLIQALSGKRVACVHLRVLELPSSSPPATQTPRVSEEPIAKSEKEGLKTWAWPLLVLLLAVVLALFC